MTEKAREEYLADHAVIQAQTSKMIAETKHVVQVAVIPVWDLEVAQDAPQMHLEQIKPVYYGKPEVDLASLRILIGKLVNLMGRIGYGLIAEIAQLMKTQESK